MAVTGPLELALADIRPALQADGGDIRLVRWDEAVGVAEVELLGACNGCSGASASLRAGVERILRDRVPGLVRVEATAPVGDHACPSHGAH